MPINDTLEPTVAAYIATNAYFTLKDWINYSDGNVRPDGTILPKKNPVAGKELSDNLQNRVLGTGTTGTYKPTVNTTLQGTALGGGTITNIHTAKTGIMTESGFGYTLTYNGQGKTHVVIAVRGTRPELKGLPLLGPDLLTDAHGSIASFGGIGSVHAGFKRTYDSMLPSLDRDRDLIARADVIHCVGHSLGGAVATLVAARYAAAGRPVKLYTFGSPRVGALLTHKILERVIKPENIFRVAHNLDPISLVGPFPYLHVNGDPNGYGYMTQPSPFNLSMKNHDMMEYIKSVDGKDWGQLVSAAKKAKHDESILVQMLLQGEGKKSWLRAGCAKSLSLIFQLFSFELSKLASSALIAGATAIDLLSQLVFNGTHKLLQLGGKIIGLMGLAAEWAEVKVAKGAEFTAAIVKAILDRMLTTLKTMVLTALTRGSIGLTPVGLAIPAWGLMSAAAL